MLLIGLILVSCEDEAPTNYIPRNYLEAIIIVDEPIQNIRVLRSQSVNQKYELENASIKDAEVIISSEGNDYILEYSGDAHTGYIYGDSNYLVKPDTDYQIEVRLKDGSVITGETHTPGRFEWIRKPYQEVYYPEDTLKLPKIDSLQISWTPEEMTGFYLLSVTCQDTLEYGKYLNPPTDEKNRRAYNVFSDEDSFYNDVTMYNLIANTSTPTVWLAFRWFGPQTITVQAPDYNYLRWFLQFAGFDGRQEYNEILTTVKGDGIGVFGSASEIKADMFLYKNQP